MIKKDTDTSIFWKKTIQISCFKVTAVNFICIMIGRWNFNVALCFSLIKQLIKLKPIVCYRWSNCCISTDWWCISWALISRPLMSKPTRKQALSRWRLMENRRHPTCTEPFLSTLKRGRQSRHCLIIRSTHGASNTSQLQWYLIRMYLFSLSFPFVPSLKKQPRDRINSNIQIFVIDCTSVWQIWSAKWRSIVDRVLHMHGEEAGGDIAMHTQLLSALYWTMVCIYSVAQA